MASSVVVKDTKWREILAKVGSVGSQIVKVGVLQGAGEQDGVALSEIAAIHEYGTRTLPERSFIRKTFTEKERELGKICERAAQAIVLKGMAVPQALGLIGVWAAAAVKRTITSGQVAPPLAASTIARKGSSKPLVDTGQLVNSITHALGDKADT